MSKVIIFPTDTVYGIGSSVFDKEGISRIYEIKNRPLDKPLAVLCANLSQIEEIAYVTDEAKKLITKFMPGALTLILKSKENIIKTMGIQTVGVRIPAYDVALEILKKIGPMATTSVNESGMPSINDYNEIINSYGKLVDEIYKPSSEKTSSLPSTVIDLTSDKLNVIRQGAITLEQITKTIK